jgi:hypothetical protein
MVTGVQDLPTEEETAAAQEAEVAEEETTPVHIVVSAESAAAHHWTEHVDAKTGKPFFYHRLNKVSTFVKPAELQGATAPSSRVLV